ncbi:serine carboxypeptidase S28 [Nitzschia inconspicua]|uniref:Serine carboxypeptidase S28 n=1 Tax=Nitzschia inconspicua TaxID=303405 RepID=A0A9K3Q4P7_9STRA|nr:serine carboxypeptidase S28 [Nitzschia inconspicua]
MSTEEAKAEASLSSSSKLTREHAPLLITGTSSYYDDENDDGSDTENRPTEIQQQQQQQEEWPSSLPIHSSEYYESRTPSTWKIMVGVLLPLLVAGGILQLSINIERHKPTNVHKHDNKFEPPPLQELYFNAKQDNFDLTSSTTFPLRILVVDDDDATKIPGEEGPLVVYTGNEGSIEDFANQTGQVFLLAQNLRGRPAFIEQRYFGTSIPSHDASINNSSSSSNSYQYLSTEQVLADLVGAIAFLKRRYGSPNVVAVGGSYGGMLTAWLQRQHPDLITAAWASSAPLLGFASTLESLQRQTAIYDIIQDNYEPSCAVLIGDAFRHMQTKQSEAEIQTILQICQQDDNNDGRIPASSLKQRAIGWLQNLLGLIANFNYPYEVSFAGRTVPKNPTRKVCDQLHKMVDQDPEQLGANRILGALEWFVNPINSTAVDDSFNLRHESSCRKLEPSFYSYNPGLIPGPWTYQHCYDLIMAYEVPESSKMFLPCSMFAPNCWSEAEFANFCEASFGHKPQSSQSRADYFGTDQRSFVDNTIVLTNGRLDPWGYAGVGYSGRNTKSANGLPENVMWMDDAAHHLDLWWPHPDDPPSVVETRREAFQLISKWVTDASQ